MLDGGGASADGMYEISFESAPGLHNLGPPQGFVGFYDRMTWQVCKTQRPPSPSGTMGPAAPFTLVGSQPGSRASGPGLGYTMSWPPPRRAVARGMRQASRSSSLGTPSQPSKGLPPLRCRSNAYLLVWDGSASSLMVREVFQNVLGMLGHLAWAQ
jgi:hypothetical protein